MHDLASVSVVLAILSTFSIGLGEFFAGAVTARARTQEVTATVFLAGFICMVITFVIWPGDPTRSDLIYGVFAGTANGVGILLLYRSYAKASLRSAAPAAAIVMSAVPIGWDVIVSGVSPSTVTTIGLVLGVAAIGLSSLSPSDDPLDITGVWMALLAGAVFGTLLILLSYISDEGGGSALLLQRTVGLVLAVAVARLTGPRIYPADRGDFAVAVVVGVFAAAAIILFVLALREGGNLAVVSVASSQYAAVAVLLGVAFKAQRMKWWQSLGLAGASLSVALIAIG